MTDKIDNRQRVALGPLEEGIKHPPGFTILATMTSPRVGWLARANHTGTLVCWTGAAVASVDQRKAEAALSDMTQRGGDADDTPDRLAAEARLWRGSATIERAAAVLGIPARTLEGVEQGRGFRYPALLRMAMAAPLVVADE